MLAFLGIGAQKAGTTWIYEQLRQHPCLSFPLGKEAHFWNREFDDPSIATYLASFGGSDCIAGEITPAYAMLPVERIRRIYACNPELRLIYLIRNPVERAWSSALMALQRAEMTIDEASDQWFIDHFRSAGSRRRGDYAACLDRWLDVFPAEQLLVLRFEQVREAPEALLNRCFEHLGVAPQPTDLLQARGCRQPVFTGSGALPRPSLLPILRELYREPLQRLAGRYGMNDWRPQLDLPGESVDR